MRRLIFTLTGVSLLDEEKELLGRGKQFKDKLDKIEDQGNIEVIITDNNILGELKKQVLGALAEKNIRDNVSNFSAEIASLHALNALEPNRKDKIILIVSHTPDCAFSGVINAKFIIYKQTNNKNWDSINFERASDGTFSCNNVEIDIIKGLQVNNAEEFRTTGIGNLFDLVSRKMNAEHNLYDEIIFNITGGFKGTIPYFTLFGMLYQEGWIKNEKIKFSIKYLYEKSREIITLPNLPVALDLPTWRDYRGFIKTIEMLSKEQADVVLQILPHQIRELFEPQHSKYKLNLFGGELQKRYDKEKTLLTPFGKGYLLTGKIKDHQKQQALRDCIDRWQYLWLGDLIPETVEHARGHAQRDLELLAQIIYPILNKEPNFFTDKEQTDNNLLALISSIWLHDIGHSGDCVKLQNDGEITIKDGNDIQRDTIGFPSMVRDIHHLLSWYLIGKDKDELFKSKSNGNWVRNESVFDDNLIEAIRLICLYHRGKMPALEGNEPFEHIGIKIKGPLEKLTSDKVNLPLLGALLRMADAGDVQRERTVSEEYEAMRILQNEREIDRLKTEEGRFREIVKATFNGGGPKTFFSDYLKFTMDVADNYFSKANAAAFELNNYFKDITKISDKKDERLKSLQENDGEKYRDEYLDLIVDVCVQKFVQDESINKIDNKDSLFLRNWLSALNQFIFKKRQPAHFEKHKGISAVMYLLDKTDEENDKKKYYFKVLAIHKNGKNIEDTNKIIQNVEHEVLKDIHDEYEKVKKILNKHHIFFDSYCRMEEGKEMVPVNFRNSKGGN